MDGGGEMAGGMVIMKPKWNTTEENERRKRMGEMKKMIELIDSYDRLPEDWFKSKIKGDMDKLKKIIHYNDYRYEQDQINEMNDAIKATPEYKLGKSLVYGLTDDGSWKDR